jgi:hypothetical protein
MSMMASSFVPNPFMAARLNNEMPHNLIAIQNKNLIF